MANDKASGGNITLIKNAPRDKNGKRKGNFSLVDQSINALAADIGLDAYGIYCFLLNNAGGNFRCTIKALASVFKKDQLSEDRIKRAINKLCKAGLLKKERCGYDGRRPLYSYHVYEVSTTAAKTLEKQNGSQHISTAAACPPIDNSDFSVDEIEQAAAGTKNCCTGSDEKPQPPAPPPMTPTNKARVKQANTAPAAQKAAAPAASSFITAQAQANNNDFKQHVADICQAEGAFSQAAKNKVIECCRLYYKELKKYADDNLIAAFAMRFSSDGEQDAATVYRQVVRL